MRYFYTTMNEKAAAGYVYECSASSQEEAEKEIIAKFEALAITDKKENVYSLCSWSNENYYKYFNEFDSLEFEEQEALLAALQRREEDPILTISYDNEIKIER